MDQAQLREFVTHGVVSLPSFLTAAQLEHYRAQAWAQLAPEANDGEDVLDGRGGGSSLGLTPSLDELPQMHALLQQISDGRFTPEHEREVTQAFCKVTLPASEAAVPLPAGWDGRWWQRSVREHGRPYRRLQPEVGRLRAAGRRRWDDGDRRRVRGGRRFARRRLLLLARWLPQGPRFLPRAATCGGRALRA